MSALRARGSEMAESNATDALKYRSRSEIESLVRAFEECTLPHSSWTHQEHLIVALWYLIHYSGRDALIRLRSGIKRLNRSHGVRTTRTRGYHETLTLFWTYLVARHVLFADAELPIEELARQVIDGYLDKNLPLKYYSKERLMSLAARYGWVSPDLRSLE